MSSSNPSFMRQISECDENAFPDLSNLSELKILSESQRDAPYVTAPMDCAWDREPEKKGFFNTLRRKLSGTTDARSYGLTENDVIGMVKDLNLSRSQTETKSKSLGNSPMAKRQQGTVKQPEGTEGTQTQPLSAPSPQPQQAARRLSQSQPATPEQRKTTEQILRSHSHTYARAAVKTSFHEQPATIVVMGWPTNLKTQMIHRFLGSILAAKHEDQFDTDGTLLAKSYMKPLLLKNANEPNTTIGYEVTTWDLSVPEGAESAYPFQKVLERANPTCLMICCAAGDTFGLSESLKGYVAMASNQIASCHVMLVGLPIGIKDYKHDREWLDTVDRARKITGAVDYMEAPVANIFTRAVTLPPKMPVVAARRMSSSGNINYINPEIQGSPGRRRSSVRDMWDAMRRDFREQVSMQREVLDTMIDEDY